LGDHLLGAPLFSHVNHPGGKTRQAVRRHRCVVSFYPPPAPATRQDNQPLEISSLGHSGR
jgi:hypothetical protein